MNLVESLVETIEVLLNYFVYLLLLRLLLQRLKVNYFNRFVQLLVKLTDFIVRPAQKLIPSFKGYDLALLFLVLVTQGLAVFLMASVGPQNSRLFLGAFFVIIGQLGVKVVNIYFYAIIIQAVLSWLPALQTGPFIELVYRIADPILRYARRWIPPIAGFDLSPIPVLLLFHLIQQGVFVAFEQFGLSQWRI